LVFIDRVNEYDLCCNISREKGITDKYVASWFVTTVFYMAWW